MEVGNNFRCMSEFIGQKPRVSSLVPSDLGQWTRYKSLHACCLSSLELRFHIQALHQL